MYMCMYMGMYMGIYTGMYVHIHVCTCVSWTSRMRVSSFLSRLHVHGAMPVQGVFVYTGHVQGGVVFKCGSLRRFIHFIIFLLIDVFSGSRLL